MTMHLLGWIYGTLNFAPLPWGCQGLKGRGSRSANDEFWRQQFRPFGHHPLAQSVGEFLDGTPTQLLYGLAHRRQGRVQKGSRSGVIKADDGKLFRHFDAPLPQHLQDD
jgi:hypothetical protein